MLHTSYHTIRHSQTKALQVIKNWNPNFSSEFFIMSDYSEAEMLAECVKSISDANI